MSFQRELRAAHHAALESHSGADSSSLASAAVDEVASAVVDAVAEPQPMSARDELLALVHDLDEHLVHLALDVLKPRHAAHKKQ